MIGGLVVWWASFYFLAPLLLPFSAYTFSGGQWTIFHEENLAWPVNIGYSLLLASTATWFGRQLTFGRSLALFTALAIGTSLTVHGVMAVLGFDYWYDSP
jgi:hypothetical protein